MKLLLALYRLAIKSVLVFVIFSLLVVARPTSQSIAAPPRELTSSCFLQPVFRLANRLFDAIQVNGFSVSGSEACVSSAVDISRPGSTLENTRYDEQVVLRFNVTGSQEAAKLASLSSDITFDSWESNEHWVDIWESNQDWVDLRIPATRISELLGHLPCSLQNYEPLLDGAALLDAIAASYSPGSYSRSEEDQVVEAAFTPLIGKINSSSTNVFFQEYRPLSVMIPWMQLLQSMFPSHVKLISMGKSYEGRDIHALRVGAHPNTSHWDEEPRKTIVVSGGMHAREWVGTSTVNYLAYSFITGYGKYLDITSLVQDFDWVFIPTLNPDGYEFTWTDDRLWRKTRQSTAFSFCPGIDLDRTFSYKWSGQASNPCSENYAGEGSFEAVEAQALANWTRAESETNQVQFVGFLDLHSYSQQILYPYSYSCADEPPTLENLEELGQGIAKAIRLGGEFYKVTSACGASVLSKMESQTLAKRETEMETQTDMGTGGSSLDWMYQEVGVRHAFQIKLRDNGAYGFLLPKEYITPTGEEMLNAVRHFGSSMQAFYVTNPGGGGGESGGGDEAESVSFEDQKPLS